MRILAVIAVVLLLVGGGMWLAQKERAASAGNAAEENVGEIGAEGAGASAGEAAEPTLPGLPAGFTEVPYLSDAPQRSFESAESVLRDGVDYAAVLETDEGPITIDLFEDEAPVTVNNFVFLALHHYYDGVPFHRVLKDFMAQTGDPTGTGTGGPGYTFDDEIAPDLHFDARGVVAMANAGPNTNGSQFFITFAPTAWLDGSYNIFGKMLAGDEALASITLVDPSTPSAVALLDDPLSTLTDQGVALDGEPGQTVEQALEASLGTLPVAGQTVTLEGMKVAVGTVGGQPGVGFFPKPDMLRGVVIASRPKQ